MTLTRHGDHPERQKYCGFWSWQKTNTKQCLNLHRDKLTYTKPVHRNANKTFLWMTAKIDRSRHTSCITIRAEILLEEAESCYKILKDAEQICWFTKKDSEERVRVKSLIIIQLLFYYSYNPYNSCCLTQESSWCQQVTKEAVKWLKKWKLVMSQVQEIVLHMFVDSLRVKHQNNAKEKWMWTFDTFG